MPDVIPGLIVIQGPILRRLAAGQELQPLGRAFLPQVILLGPLILRLHLILHQRVFHQGHLLAALCLRVLRMQHMVPGLFRQPMKAEM